MVTGDVGGVVAGGSVAGVTSPPPSPPPPPPPPVVVGVVDPPGRVVPVVPVVPVGIAGAHECLPMGKGLKGFSPLGLRHTRQNVVVAFGEPVDGHTLAEMPLKEALRRMEGLVRAQVTLAREVHKSRQKV